MNKSRIGKIRYSMAGLKSGDIVYFICKSKSFVGKNVSPVEITIDDPIKNTIIVNSKHYRSILDYMRQTYGFNKLEQPTYYTYKKSTIKQMCLYFKKLPSELNTHELNKALSVYEIANPNYRPGKQVLFY